MKSYTIKVMGNGETIRNYIAVTNRSAVDLEARKLAKQYHHTMEVVNESGKVVKSYKG